MLRTRLTRKYYFFWQHMLVGFFYGGGGGGSEGYGSLIDFHIGWFFVCVCGFGSALWSERVFFDAADENCASPELAT